MTGTARLLRRVRHLVGAALVAVAVGACATGGDPGAEPEAPAAGEEVAEAEEGVRDAEREAEEEGAADEEREADEELRDAAADTARGRVVFVGTDPVNVPVLRRPDRPGEIALVGDLLGVLERLTGLDVEVRGRLEEGGRRMDVAEVDVRGMGDVPAADGILRRDADGFVLETDDGPRPVAGLPPRLEERVGAWIWVAGEAGEPAEAYGVIDRNP